MSNILDPIKQKRFETLEKICEAGRAVFFIVGRALEEIKREKFYETKGFKNFGDYCESIGFTKRHGNQLIIESGVVDELPEALRKLVQSERAARELMRLPPALRVEVVKLASDDGKKPVGSAEIKKATPKSVAPQRPATTKPKSSPPSRPKQSENSKPVITDGTGLVIPEDVLAFWNRTSEAVELLTYISSVRTKLKSAQEKSDPLFRELDFTDDLAKLNQVWEDLKRAKPFAICPTCNGIVTSLSEWIKAGNKSDTFRHCVTCKGRGFVSEFYWFNNVTEEVRNLRANSLAK